MKTANKSIGPAKTHELGRTGTPTPAAIAEAAYYLAEKRGFAPGHEVDDWLTAERQLRQPTTPRAGAH
jgi:hypothetical protein